MLHAGNADGVRARLVVEGANGAAHPGRRRGPRRARASIVVPDILANAGGVVVSYLEWVQNLQNVRWERRQVDEELAAAPPRRPRREVRERAAADGCSLRQAAHRVAVSRVARPRRCAAIG